MEDILRSFRFCFVPFAFAVDPTGMTPGRTP